MKSIKSAGLLIGLMTLLLGCGPFGAGEGGQVDIRGTITSIHRADTQSQEEGIMGTVLIEGAVEEDTEFDKASVTITEETRIFEQEGQGRRAVTFEALQVGQRVEARFTGPVMESYPVQATAREIVILQ
jgi:hypothetical protein